MRRCAAVTKAGTQCKVMISHYTATLCSIHDPEVRQASAVWRVQFEAEHGDEMRLIAHQSAQQKKGPQATLSARARTVLRQCELYGASKVEVAAAFEDDFRRGHSKRKNCGSKTLREIESWATSRAIA